MTFAPGEESFELSEPTTWTAIAHGHPSILFALLAGVSLALMSGGTRIPEVAQMPALRLKILGRGAAIFLIGCALELLSTRVEVILTFYGMLYFLALPFLRSSIKRLLTWAVVLAFIGPALMTLRWVLFPQTTGLGIALISQPGYSLGAWLPLMLTGIAIGRTDLSKVKTALSLLGIGLVFVIFSGLVRSRYAIIRTARNSMQAIRTNFFGN